MNSDWKHIGEALAGVLVFLWIYLWLCRKRGGIE